MAKQAGKLITISIESSTPGSFVLFGGLTQKSVRMNGATIDVTDSESTDLWVELLDGGGLKSMEISGSGRFNDDAAIERARLLFMTGSLEDFKFFIPSWGTFAGQFSITSLEFGGAHDSEVTFSATFMSSGKPTWTAS
ncbi:MAG: phage major tail protein, TP901-1 family [Beijerinckiaceae bacterium]